MYSGIFLYILDFYMNILSKICGFVLDPLFDYLVENNWFSSNYFDIVQDFIFNKFLPSLKFSRDVFINITGVNVEIFIIIGGFLLGMLTLSFSFIGVKALLNAYFFIRGGRSIGVFSKK